MEQENKKKEFQKMPTITMESIKMRVFLFLHPLKIPSEMEEKMTKRHLISLILSSYNQVSLIYTTVLCLESHKVSKFNLILLLTVNQKLAKLILRILNILFVNQKFMMVKKQSK